MPSRLTRQYSIAALNILALLAFTAGHPLPVRAVDETAAVADQPICQCVCPSPPTTTPEAETTPAPTETTLDETVDEIAPETTAAVAASPQREIYFSELLPDPVGKDTDGEFIEIRNAGDEAVVLDGWTIRTSSEKTFTISTRTIAADSYLSFPYAATKLTLTNTGTDLTLSDEAGMAVDTVSFAETAKEGQSYAKNDVGLWLWTTAVTNGSANAFPAPETPSATEAVGTNATTDAADTTATNSVSDAVAPAATTAASTTAADAAVTPGSPKAIVISEFLPNPVGSDDYEWIELRNDGGDAVSLAGWTLDDADGGSKPFTLTADDVIAPRGWLLLPKSRTGLALNNDGDSVRLFRPDGQAVEAIRYGNAAEGESFAGDPDGWHWTKTPTPGAANTAMIQLNEAEKPESDRGEAASFAVEQSTAGYGPDDDSEAAAPLVDIAEIAELETSAVVTVSGIVNIPSGRIGKTLVGLQNDAGTAGITARFYGDSPPAMGLGQIWSLTGRISRVGDEVRISTRSRDVTMTGQRQLMAEPRAIADISEADAGLFLDVSGIITSSGKNWLSLTGEDGVGEVRVSLADGMGTAMAAKGGTAAAAGVLRFRQGRPELVVAARSGLRFITRPISDIGDVEPKQGAEISVDRPPLMLAPTLDTSPNYAAYGSLAALTVAAGLAAVWWKKRQYSDIPEQGG